MIQSPDAVGAILSAVVEPEAATQYRETYSAAIVSPLTGAV